MPASAKVMVFWYVTSGSPDYGYKLGEGTSSGPIFGLRLAAPPPTEALNGEELGVGLILLVPSDWT